MRVPSTWIPLLIAITVVFSPRTVSAGVKFSLLDMYREEIARLVDAPGASSSIAAGRINPAAWPIQRRGGLYLSFEDLQSEFEVDDITGVISLNNLGFGVRHFDIEGVHRTEYALGLGFGNRNSTFGVSLIWDSGDTDRLGNSTRIANGSIYRWSWGSLGLNTIFDFDQKQTLDQADLALRPFGPRLTVFADFLGWYDEDIFIPTFDYDDHSFGYGIEFHAMPGLAIAARADDDGLIGLRVNIGLDKLRPTARVRIDDDGDHQATTYAVEYGRGPSLRDALPPGTLGGHESYPTISLRGPVVYRNYGWFDNRTRLIALLATLDALADDPEVEGLLVNLSGVQMNVATLWELRAQFAGMRARGVKLLFYSDRLNLASYMMASVADELWMDPMGSLDIRGLSFGRSYYKEMLAKAGVGFEEWRYWRYKSAVEVFARDSFSDGAREQLQAVLDSFWESLVGTISAARGIEFAEIERIIDEKGSVLPHEAEALGLVDMIGSFNDMREGRREAVRRPGPDRDVAVLGATFGDRVWRNEEWGEAPRIAVIYAIGPTQMNSGIRGRELSKWIRKMRDDESVKAIVMRADSPGGDPLPSDLVARELRAASEVKPVIVSQGRVAGSGGYWISMDGDKILASPYTITGSIGVISGHIYDDGIAERFGIDYDHIQKGRGADLERGPGLPLVGISIPHRPSTTEERARVEEIIRDLYGNFVQSVADGRGMETSEVEAIAQGRIWTGVDGKEIGLVDEIGGLWSAILLAKQAAGLDADDRVQLVEGPKIGLLSPSFFKPKLIGARLAAAFNGEQLERPMSVESDPSRVLRPAFLASVLSEAQWSAMPLASQAYLRHVLESPGTPVLLMDSLEGLE